MIDYSKSIYTILSGSSVSGYTTNIYPLVAPLDTPLPLITFKRTFSNRYTNDYFACTDISLEVVILSDTYINCVDIATLVNDVLFENNILLSDVDEFYNDGIFGQILNFSDRRT